MPEPLPLLHDCRHEGEWLRHRTVIACVEHRLNSGGVRMEGVRCDGTPIHAIGRRTAHGLELDPCTAYDERLRVDGDRAWRSVGGGPWEPLVDLEGTAPDQDVLSLGGAA